MALTETWLRPSSLDQATIGAMAPPCYTICHEPRSMGRVFDHP